MTNPLTQTEISRKHFDTVYCIHQIVDGSGEGSANTLSQEALFYCRDVRPSDVGRSWFMVNVLGTHARTKPRPPYNNNGGSLGCRSGRRRTHTQTSAKHL